MHSFPHSSFRITPPRSSRGRGAFRAVAATVAFVVVVSAQLWAVPAAQAESLAVVASLVNPGQTTVQTREALPYSVAVADAPSTGGVVTATLTNAQWGTPTANQTQTYCQAYGGTFAFASGNSVWTCSGLTFSASAAQFTFTPTAWAPTSAAGTQVGLTVQLVTSNGTTSSSTPLVSVLADHAGFSVVPSVTTGSGTDVLLGGDLVAQAPTGTAPLTETPSVSYTLGVPVGAQTCSNESDTYGGPSCTPVTSVPYVARNLTSVTYPNAVTESNFDTTTQPAKARTSSQPGGAGTPVTVTGTPTDPIYPSPTKGGSVVSNFVYTGGLLQETATLDPSWLRSLRYPTSSPVSGSYQCTWTAVSNTPTVSLTTSSGSCGTFKSSTIEEFKHSFGFGAGGVHPVVRLVPNGALPSVIASAIVQGTVPAPAGAVLCLKFDNSRDQIRAAATGASGVGVLEYGAGNWGASSVDTAHSTYALRAGNCASSDVPRWYTFDQIDLTNTGAPGKLINANQINAIRGVTSSITAPGARANFTFGDALMALGTDTRGAALKPGDVHLWVPQTITSSGRVWDAGQCAGADDVAKTCPVSATGPAPIENLAYGVSGYGPMSAEYTLNGVTAGAVQSANKIVYLGAGVTGQYLLFRILTSGAASQAIGKNKSYTSQPIPGQPLVAVPNVTTTTVFPTGVIIDCLSVVPSPVSCVSTGSGATVKYTVQWVTGSLAQSDHIVATVPGYIDSQAPSATYDVVTTVVAPGQQPQTDDTSTLRFTAVKQNQPSITKTASSSGIFAGEPANWTLSFSTPASISVGSANAYDILPYDGDPFGSRVTGTFALSALDVSGAPGAAVRVSATPPAELDLLDGLANGYLNPQTQTAQDNAQLISDAFSCTLAQAGSAGCPTLSEVTAVNVSSSGGFLSAGTSKSVRLAITTAGLRKGDVLKNGFSAQMDSFVTFFSPAAAIAVADPSFTVAHSVSPITETGPGTTATYSVVVTNTGNVPLPFRTLTPTITTDISGLIDDTATPVVTSASGTAAISGGILTWTPPVIAPGASATLTFTALVNKPPTGDSSLVTKVSAPTNTYAATPTGLDCPVGSNAAACATRISVSSAPVFTSAAPTAKVANNAAYSFTVKASGHTPPTFSVTSGALPPGLALDSVSGVISGKSTVNGVYSFRISASNSSPLSPVLSPQYSITVGTVPVMGASAPPVATAGQPFSFTFTATGSPAPTFSVSVAGSLPPGLTLDSATGILSGTPTTSGSFPYRIVATNVVGASGKDYTGVVASIPAITSAAPPTATVASPYSFTVTATGSPAPTFTVSSGSLPTGLALNSTTGVISGTPSAAGSFSYVVTASNGASSVASASYTTQAATAPVITSSTPPSAVLGAPYAFTVTASGQPAPTFSISAGALPTGLSLDGATGKISGTPTVMGQFTYTVRAANASNAAAVQQYTTDVSSTPALTSNPPTNPATVGTAYSFTFTASGTPAPTFTSTGSLPTGLTLTPTGVLSGVPTTPGSFSFTINATNGVGSSAQGSFTLDVVSNPVITSAAPPSPATLGEPYSFQLTATGSPASSFSISSGALPAGLALSAAGVISGTPSSLGHSTFTVRADNGSAVAATSTYSIDVYSTPVITSAVPSSGTVGFAYSFTVTASGTPTPGSFAVSSGALPTGLSLNSSTGDITGMPTVDGEFTYTVSASNGSTTPGSAVYTTRISIAPVITSAAPPSPATIGSPYSFTVTASGSPSPTFAIGTGTLPAGLQLDAATGVISGTPTAPGSSSFSIVASNASEQAQDTASYTIVSALAPQITSGMPPVATTTVPYDFTIAASGSPSPTFSVTAGVLPTGLSLAADGHLTGTPTAPGEYTYTVTAANGAVPSASTEYTTTVVSNPVITSAAPTSPGTVDSPYAFTITATGSPAPSFVVSAGSLPSGISLDPVSGELTGTPTAAGTFDFTVLASNGSQDAASEDYSIRIVSNPTITSVAPPSPATVGVPYAFTVTASATPAPSSFTIVSGGLPAGLSIDEESGSVTGTPLAPGTYTFTLAVSNGSAVPAQATYTIAVATNPVITSDAPSSATVGVDYSFTVSATGSPKPTFSVASGSLPAGLTLDPATGVLGGVPAVSGSFPVTIRADNGSAAPATQSYSIHVSSVPEITSIAPPTGTVGSVYAFTVTATAEPAVTNFSLASGALPDGLSLNAATGKITGTPVAAGSFNYTISASNGGATHGTASYTTLTASVPVVTSSDPTSPATVGTEYDFAVTASGTPAPRFTVTSGQLPAGLELDSVTGVISGTPSSAGSATFTITVANEADATATAEYTIVSALVPQITSAEPPTATLAAPYTFTVTASGSPTPVFSVSAGSLPDGLTLNTATGAITGTPTATGSFSYTITASNGAVPSARADYTTTVASNPEFTSGAPASPATVGVPYSFTLTATGDPGARFSLAPGGLLPAGLTLDALTGVIAGTPTGGSSEFTVVASTGSAVNAEQTYSIDVLVNPQITSGVPVSPATVGGAYSFSITASGSTPMSFEIAEGSLPAGLVLDSRSGAVTGVPLITGTSTFTVRVSNGSAQPAEATYVIEASTGAVITSEAPPSPATVGVRYDFTVTAVGTPAPTFSVSQGTLPAGLELDADSGALSGVPTTAGSWTFSITADNGSTLPATVTYTVVVATNPVLTSGAPTSPVTTGVDYSFAVTASGSPAPVYSVAAGSLPGGLSIDPMSGVIAGVPAGSGSFEFTVRADNGSAAPAEAQYTIDVLGVPEISSIAPPTGTVGSAYSFTVTATAVPPVTSFTVVGGALPDGLSLNSASGKITGTPTTAGSFDYTLAASNGSATPGSASYTTVIASLPTISSGAPHSPATVGVDYAFTVTASGSPDPKFAITVGALPAGLALDPTTGVISGVPTAGATARFTVTADNGSHTPASADYTIVAADVPAITSGTPSPANLKQAYSFAIVASGYPSSTFAVTAGGLPAGLALDESGVISGIPLASGSFTFTVTAHNGAAQDASRTYILVVNAEPVPPVELPIPPAGVPTPPTGAGSGGSSGSTPPDALRALAKLTITPPARTVTAGDSVDFTVHGWTADYALVGELTPHVKFITDDPTDTFSAASIRFTNAGEHTVTATLNGVTAVAKITVVADEDKPSASSLRLELKEKTVTQGSRVELTLTGKDVFGNSYGPIAARAVLSSTRTADVFETVGDTTTVTFAEAGRSVITAEIFGESVELAVDVAAAPRASWLWWLLPLALLIPAGIAVRRSTRGRR